MDPMSTPGVRAEPDPAVTTATPASTAPAFAALDRRIGWFTVNRWTYRPARLLARLVRPVVDDSGVEVTEVATGQGLLVVRPATVRAAGAVLLVHGGGYVLGSPETALGKAAMLARACGVPVVCPAYRLGPEHPFPAGLDDCHAAWSWVQSSAEHLGVEPGRVVVGGISAGGGLAAGLVQRLVDEGGTQPAGQVLIYPMLDDRTATRRELDALGHRVWNNRSNAFGWRSWLGHEPGAAATQPYAAPARREDLTGLPPAWIGVGTADLFLDEDRAYARRLREAGVDVTYVEVDGGIHSFDEAQEAAATRAFDASMARFVSATVG